VLKFESYLHKDLIECDNSYKRTIPLATSENHTFLRAPNSDYKAPFAKWIVEKANDDPSILEPFRLIFERLYRIIDSDAITNQK
jgi:hypothetical protein